MSSKHPKIYGALEIPDQRSGNPLFGTPISAGWPSPAEDYVEDMLDLHKLLVRNAPATFFLRVQGDSMIGASINNGDLLVVDRSIEPISGKIVIAAWDGELTVKRLKKTDRQILLVPENPAYKSLDITKNQEAIIWGVVTYVVHKLG